MNIDGLSIKTLEQLYDKFHVSTFSDLYKLNEKQLSELDGFKDKKISNILASIEKSKIVKLSNFIFALGIDGVGVKTAKQLAKHYKTIESLRNASIEELVTLDDIAEISATDIYNFFRNPENKTELDELLSNFVDIDSEKSIVSGGFFANKKVVLTGTLSSFSRKQAEDIIESQGGSTSSSVSNATDIVLAGENAGSKLDKAKKLGIYIMNEDEFISHIN